MASYFEMASGKAMVIQLVDAKVGATELDQQSTEYLRSVGVDPIVVATKADRVKKGKLQATLGTIQRDLGLLDSVIIPFAAPSGEGSKQIWRSIEDYLDSFDNRGANQGGHHV